MAMTEKEIMEIFEIVAKARAKAGKPISHGTLIRPGEEDTILVPVEEPEIELELEETKH